jgi:hypothetical protein|tara:strand:+ start:98 stop:394 length:297 start_codon:yes stop_codon:yes gene_type:complete
VCVYQPIGDKMNINTVWTNTIDSMSSIKDKVIDKYNTTNMNPFPKNVNVTVKFDLVGTYSDLLKKFDSMSDKDMQRVVDILEKKSDIIQKIIMKQLDK